MIPNGTPHWFKNVKAPLLYYVVKVRQAARETAVGGHVSRPRSRRSRRWRR